MLSQLNGYSLLLVYQVYLVYGEFFVDVCCLYCLIRVLIVIMKYYGNLIYVVVSFFCFMG